MQNNIEELRNELFKLGVRREQPQNMFKVLIKPSNKNILTQRQKQYFREKINNGGGAGLSTNYVIKNNLDKTTNWYFLDPYDFKNKVDYNAYEREIKQIKQEYPRLFNIIYDFVLDECGFKL